METYLVGGAVRDALLGLPVLDRDWVVVGATPESMIDQGYTPVGKDFPVFLHPQTHEEYALARTERKSGPGYHGFVFNTDKAVTLEDDLARRDLTINAIAQSPDGHHVDPYSGQKDLEKRVLRHVSPAFSEDPVRVLRVARFMARLAPMGFRLAPETLELMQSMTRNGEVAHLVAERTWQELERALASASPRAFFETLRACDALAVVLPEVARLFGVPQPARYHPEIDSGLHMLMVLDESCKLSTAAETRFAAICHDLGKGNTDPACWPSHRGHEERGAQLAAALCERLRAPRRFRELATLTARYHTHCHKAQVLKASTLTDLLDKLDILRKPERFTAFVQVCMADTRGRLGFDNADYPQAAFLERVAAAYRSVDAAGVARACSAPQLIPDAIRQARIAAVKAITRD